MIKKIFTSVFLIFLLVFSGSFAEAQEKVFTPEELSQYDGKDGHQAYYAYEGKVYDVSSSPLWKLGEHFGVHAGEDLTGKMEGAPHGMEVFAPFEVVGKFESTDTPIKTEEVESMARGVPDADQYSEEDTTINRSEHKEWYEGRIRLLGFSLLGWTGIFLGIFFVFTFATCFGLPWAKLPLPWAGSKPGPDPLDNNPNHMGWSSVHKYFVWVTVVLGVIHGLVGFLQMIGIYL